jgi:hypothetical protein
MRRSRAVLAVGKLRSSVTPPDTTPVALSLTSPPSQAIKGAGCSCCGRMACMGTCVAQTRNLHAHPNPPSNPTQALEYLLEGNKVGI